MLRFPLPILGRFMAAPPRLVQLAAGMSSAEFFPLVLGRFFACRRALAAVFCSGVCSRRKGFGPRRNGNRVEPLQRHNSTSRKLRTVDAFFACRRDHPAIVDMSINCRLIKATLLSIATTAPLANRNASPRASRRAWPGINSYVTRFRAMLPTDQRLKPDWARVHRLDTKAKTAQPADSKRHCRQANFVGDTSIQPYHHVPDHRYLLAPRQTPRRHRSTRTAVPIGTRDCSNRMYGPTRFASYINSSKMRKRRCQCSLCGFLQIVIDDLEGTLQRHSQAAHHLGQSSIGNLAIGKVERRPCGELVKNWLQFDLLVDGLAWMDTFLHAHGDRQVEGLNVSTAIFFRRGPADFLIDEIAVCLRSCLSTPSMAVIPNIRSNFATLVT
jgi:hypothetical protein